MKHKRKNLILFVILATAFGSLSTQAFSQMKFHRLVIDDNCPKDPWGKSIGDINDDGLTDLIVQGFSGEKLVWYKNPGRPSAKWKKYVVAKGLKFSTDAEVADVDHDGFPDIVSIVEGSLYWFKNDGTPEDGKPWKKTFIHATKLHDIEVGDFDGDGDIDVVGRDQTEWEKDGNILYFFEQVSPTEWKSSTRSCPGGEGLLATDIDGDGKADIVTGNRWYKNPGNMNAADWKEYVLSKTWNYGNVFIATGDFNGDGLKDIVLTPSERDFNTYHISWFEHPKNPTDIWKEHIIEKDEQCVDHFVGCGDFDLDSNVDIVCAEMEQGKDPDAVKIFRNEGKGKSWKKIVLWGGGSHSCRVFDCDNDGDLDFFGANWRGSEVNLWVNDAISRKR